MSAWDEASLFLNDASISKSSFSRPLTNLIKIWNLEFAFTSNICVLRSVRLNWRKWFLFDEALRYRITFFCCNFGSDKSTVEILVLIVVFVVDVRHVSAFVQRAFFLFFSQIDDRFIPRSSSFVRVFSFKNCLKKRSNFNHFYLYSSNYGIDCCCTWLPRHP